jgi:arylsulfatase A-like enzyme
VKETLMKRPTRRGLLKAAGAAALGAVASASIPRFPHRSPRFILAVCVDCLRADQLGPYGAVENITPFLNSLARTSVVFERAYANGNWTKPSVASFFTGLYPSEHGVTASVKPGVDASAEGVSLSPDVVTLAEVYREAGYRTAAFLQQPHLVEELGFAQGFDVYRQGGGNAEKLAHDFVEWYDGISVSTRVFAYLHFLDCHSPYLPPEDYKGLFGPVDLALPKDEHWSKPGVWAGLRDAVNAGERSITREQASHFMNMYKGEVRYVDYHLSRIFDALERRGVLDQSLTVVFADHGDNFLEHGVLGHQPPHFFQPQIRIPILLKLPKATGVRPGVRRERVQTIDVSATLATVAGCREFGRGRDLLGDAVREGEFIITESDKGMSVIKGGLKAYVTWSRGAPVVGRVYNVEADPTESTDVIESSRDYVHYLTRFLPRWRAEAECTRAALVGVGGGAAVSRENLDALRALGYVN